MEKKVAGGNIAVVLGIMCIVFVAGLGGTIASYTSIISSKDKTNQDYISTHSHTDTQFNTLQSSLNDYTSTHTYTDSQYNNYAADHQYTNEEYNAAVAAVSDPKLLTVGVTTDDEWSTPPFGTGTDTFTVTGYVVNSGGNTAYNVQIHVVGYANIDVKVIDDYVSLANMDGGSAVPFNSSFVYTSGPLYHWTITPQWTNTP